MRNYLYLLGDADHELSRLADALQKRKQRTALLFMAIARRPCRRSTTRSALPTARQRKPSQCRGCCSTTAASSPNGPMDTTAWLLPSILLETAGIGGDRYFATLAALRDSLATDVMASSGGLPGELRALGQLRFRNELEPILDTVLDGPVAEADVAIAP
ncbi:MAG: hypothetical protein IPH43_16060 [Xanthomonadales bacterium]|nr:hypothetical protein [Xanthomonadales bacterium]